jgi:hypothetical protein
MMQGIFAAPVADSLVASVGATDSTIILKGSSITLTFSRKDGSLVSVVNSRSNPVSFKGGPVLAGGSAGFSGISYRQEGKTAMVEVQYSGGLKGVRWTMQPDGWVSLDYTYHIKEKVPFAGISFNYPENYVLGARWLGMGPYRVWKNRLQGGTRNVWQSHYNNTQTGAAPWVFPEFKGYYGNVSWMELNTVEGKIIMATPDSGLYVRLFHFYGLSGVVPSPALPPGDMSFLDAIPPIGTKLALNIDYKTDKLGPQSELTQLPGPVSHRIWFYFGMLPQAKPAKQAYTAPVKDELFDIPN